LRHDYRLAKSFMRLEDYRAQQLAGLKQEGKNFNNIAVVVPTGFEPVI